MLYTDIGLLGCEVNINVSKEHSASIFKVDSKINAACPLKHPCHLQDNTVLYMSSSMENIEEYHLLGYNTV
jgi:hypothetical protein